MPQEQIKKTTSTSTTKKIAYAQWMAMAKDPYDREIADGVTFAGEAHRVPTYRDLLTTYTNRSGCENALKIPKGTIFRFVDHNHPIILKQSLSFDQNRGQWFAIEPHTSEDKDYRQHSLQHKGTLLSFMAPINLDDPASFQGLQYTQIKKTMVVPANATLEQKQAIIDKQRQIAYLTKAFSGVSSDCFERQTTSKKHQISMTKIETVTDFIQGEDLITFLENHQPTLLTTVKIVIAILEALKLPQQNGIVHCDLKPEHFIITRKGDSSKIKIIDWELACKNGETNSSGTPGFAAPEAFTPQKRQFASDMFSMGIIISYMLLRSSTPFEQREKNIMGIIEQLSELKKTGCCADKPEYKAVIERYVKARSSIPSLFNDVSIDLMWQIFPELERHRADLGNSLALLFRDMLGVVDDLTKLNPNERIKLDTVLNRFRDIDKRLSELLSPQNQTQPQTQSPLQSQSQQSAAVAVEAAVAPETAAVVEIMPAAEAKKRPLSRSVSAQELSRHKQAAEKENRDGNMVANGLSPKTAMNVVQSSKGGDTKSQTDEEADKEVAELTSKLEELELRDQKSGLGSSASSAGSTDAASPSPQLFSSKIFSKTATLFRPLEKPLAKKVCQGSAPQSQYQPPPSNLKQP